METMPSLPVVWMAQAASKTSLKGWKPSARFPQTTQVGLKNFLKGMETCAPPARICPASASKTSLKGWKPLRPARNWESNARLKNFLKGMETRRHFVRTRTARNLKNFLKGMETGEQCRGHGPDPRLKNFLKGMETTKGLAADLSCEALKNFLKGMETMGTRTITQTVTASKTSLKGWKRDGAGDDVRQ